MAYGNREMDDEQTLLQQALGGDQPVSQTQPMGGGMAIQPVADEPPAQAAVGNDMASRKALGGYNSGGTMLGFNTALDYGNDKAANSMKNTFGRIASRYAANPNSLDAVLNDADFKRMFPNAKKAGFDKIDFGGMLSDFESGVPVGVVDVGGAFDPTNNTGAGWTWQDLANDGGGAPAGGDALGALMGGADPLSSASGNIDQLGNSDVLAQILSALQGAGGADSLQALLGGR